MKIFECIFGNCLCSIITPNQCGFVKGSETTGAIHTTCLLMEKYREKNIAFLDLEDTLTEFLIHRSDILYAHMEE